MDKSNLKPGTLIAASFGQFAIIIEAMNPGNNRYRNYYNVYWLEYNETGLINLKNVVHVL